MRETADPRQDKSRKTNKRRDCPSKSTGAHHAHCTATAQGMCIWQGMETFGSKDTNAKNGKKAFSAGDCRGKSTRLSSDQQRSRTKERNESLQRR